jgi:mRNA interferase HigB
MFPQMGTLGVRLIGVAKLGDFARRYTAATKPLANWEKVVRAASWKNSQKLKRTFNSVDYFQGQTIFDIGGNKFRLIATINYEEQFVEVTDVLTHVEYDKDRWK